MGLDFPISPSSKLKEKYIFQYISAYFHQSLSNPVTQIPDDDWLT